MGNRLAKPAALSARVLLAAGLGTLGWTFFSTTTAAASDESAGSPALEATLQTAESPAAELADPAAAAVDVVAGQATSVLTGADAPAPQQAPAEVAPPAVQPAPADLAVVQELGAVIEDTAAIVEAPATEVVHAVEPAAEAVVQELNVAVEHLDAAVQDAGLPAVLPEEPLTTVTDAVVGQVDEAVGIVTDPIEVVTGPVEKVLEPVTDRLRPAAPILPEPPAVPATDSEPAPAAPMRTGPVPTSAEPASQVAETTPGLATSREVSFRSTDPEGPVVGAEAINPQAQSPGQGQGPSLQIMQFGASSISRADVVPSPMAGPIWVSSFPLTNGGSSGGGGGSAGPGSAEAYLAGGEYQWVDTGLAHRTASTALPASPAFDPGSTPD